MLLKWFLVVLFCAILQPQFALKVNITRSLRDIFSTGNCMSCAKFNRATCLKKGVCRCPTSASTFFVHKKLCSSPSELINGEHCLSLLRNKNSLKVINPTSSSSIRFQIRPSVVCVVYLKYGTEFEYLGHKGKWKKPSLPDHQPVFSIQKKDGYMEALQISGNNNLIALAGRIIRVNLLCNNGSFGGERKSCLILKAAGTISTTVDVSPSQSITTTHGISTAVGSSTAGAQATTEPQTTYKNHYIWTQSAKHDFTSTPSNSTLVTLVRINGAVSIDTKQETDTVVVAIISVLGAVACVLVISAFFAWFSIKYYRRFSGRQAERNARQPTVLSNLDIQNAIPMSTRIATLEPLPEPVYSELPDIVESTNQSRLQYSADFPVEKEEFFVIRNPLLYNTLPRARYNTDPLPVPPPPRPSTPEPWMSFKTRVNPNATKTARFLSEVSRELCIPSYQDLPRTRRKRSYTDVDDDNVFFENVLDKGLVVNLDGEREKEAQNKNAGQSFYQDLSETSKVTSISIYEPLEKTTIQSSDIRKTTLEKIKNQETTDDASPLWICTTDTQPALLHQESVPEYHILEPSPQHDSNPTLPTHHDYLILEESESNEKTNDVETFSTGKNIKEPYILLSTEHLVVKGTSAEKAKLLVGHDFDVQSSADKNKQASAKTSEGNPSNNRSSDSLDCRELLGLNREFQRTSKKLCLRRTKSSDI